MNLNSYVIPKFLFLLAALLDCGTGKAGRIIASLLVHMLEFLVVVLPNSYF